MQINRSNFWIWNNYFGKLPISHVIQNYWKKTSSIKLDLLWALQFQFHCGTYPIGQLSSLKLPIYSQWTQVSSSKSVSVPNVRRDFHDYFAKQSTTLTKHFITIWIGMSLLTFWKLNSSKILVLQWLLGFMLVYCSQKWNVYLPKKVCQIIINRNPTHILDMSCCHKHQQKKI